MTTLTIIQSERESQTKAEKIVIHKARITDKYNLPTESLKDSSRVPS